MVPCLHQFSACSGAENAGTTPSNGVILDELSEQYQHQNIKSTIFKAKLSLFLYKYGEYFSWEVKLNFIKNATLLQIIITFKLTTSHVHTVFCEM